MSKSRSRESYKSPETSREYKKRIVKLEPTEEDDLGIKDLLDKYEPTFAGEENRKELRKILSEDNGNLGFLYQHIFEKKELCIFSHIIPIYIEIPNTSMSLSNKLLGMRDFNNFLIFLSRKKEKKFTDWFNQITYFKNFRLDVFYKSIDIKKFREECNYRYIIFNVASTIIEVSKEVKLSSHHASVLIFDKKEMKGFYIDPQYNQNDAFYLEIEEKLKFFIQMILYSDEDEVFNLIELYKEYEYEDGKKIEMKIKKDCQIIEIKTLKQKCPQSIANDKNCIFWSLFLADTIFRNFDPENDLNPDTIINRIIELYPKPKQLETIILKYITYLNSIKSEEEEGEELSPRAGAGGPKEEIYGMKFSSRTVSPSRTKTPSIGNFFGSDEDYFEYTPTKSRTRTVSPSRTKTPSIRSFFGSDEDYFEYTPTKSRTRTVSPSRTKTPSIRSFFGDKDEDYFEYTPTKSRTRTVSPSRTKTPSIRSFFGDKDEDYFEYTPSRTKSSSAKASYSPSSPSRTKSKTVSPRLGFLYGDEEDF
jgi:hypothetical protein